MTTLPPVTNTDRAIIRRGNANLVSDKWIPNPRPFPQRPPSEWPAPTPIAPADEAPAPEPDPGEPPSRARIGMILGVIGVALAAAVVTYLVLRVIRPPKPKVQAPVMTTVPPDSTTTTLPEGPVITASRLAQLTDELVPFVERTRQLRFTSHPTTVLDDAATYEAAHRRYVARSSGWTDRLSAAFEVLGLNANDADMARSVLAFEGTKTVVFYDQVANIIHVRATQDTPYLSTMLVMGLTEQLDDQHFRTDAVAAPTAFGDATFGLATLVGGDAWRVASAWANGRSVVDQQEIRSELQARRGAVSDTSRVPSALADWLRYPADHGVDFTANLVTATSSAPLDAVFEAPPDGSAQVLAPARITAKVAQLPVAGSKVDGKVTASGTFGRLFLESLLGTLVPDDLLQLALNGYRGDLLTVYEGKDSASCARLDVTTGDSAPDHMAEALGEWASKRDGQVSRVADPDRAGHQLVRLQVCSGGGGSPDTTTTTTTPAASGTNPSSTIPGGPLP